MAQHTLEERVAHLEQLMEQVLHQQTPELQPGRDDWQRTFGMFAGDPVMKQIIDAGKRIRDDDRQTVES
jgi:hypothetical protein